MMNENAAEILRLIGEGTAAVTGTEFFESLVRCVAGALSAQSSFVGEFSEDSQTVRTRAFWIGGKLVANLDYAIEGTPCECVLQGEIVAFDSKVRDLFPEHREELAAIGAESYLAIPLKNRAAQVIGHLAVIDTRAREWRESELGILHIFAARAAAELERRKVEVELEAARHAAEAANRAKTEFLANMSHELRTPLNGILGYAQLLKLDDGLDSRQRENVDAIERCGEHLLELISEVLDLAKIEAGRMELAADEVDLNSLLTDVADIARVRATHASLGFAFDAGPGLPPAVRVDGRRLRQVLLNLLGNAVKFTPSGRVRFAVRAEQVAAGRRLHFEVEDTGTGISQSDLPHIFEPFFQTRNASGHREGTGLGLTITRRIVQAMGGRLEVDSTPGRGSVFRIELDVPEVRGRVRAWRADRRRVTGYVGRRRTILVVDDKTDNRQLLARLLGPLGFDVHEAADGQAALELLSELRPDLVFMDLVMPVLDGFQALRAMRRIEAMREVPVVAVSASAFDTTRRHSSEVGFDDFLAKPYRMQDVLDLLGHRLGIEWVQAGEAAIARPAPQMVLASSPRPSPERMALLEELARLGDIQGFAACLDEIEASEPACRPFVETLREMARSFDMRGIRHHLSAGEATVG